MDFGLAKQADAGATAKTGPALTVSGDLLGTPRYMSPEVVIGKRADGRSDIFSLGIILHEMLTGMAPFSGETVSGLMFQTINFVPPPPSAVNPAVPSILNFIVAKMLAKKREERYQDARELANDLHECLAQLRCLNIGTRPGHPASGAARPAPSLLDANARTELLAGALQMTRVTDVDRDVAAAAPTLGISRTFDSLEATHQLAVRTGMERAFDDYAATLRIAAPAAAAARGAASAPAAPAYRVVSAPPEASGPRRPPQPGWGHGEWWVLGVGLALAVAIAAAIVYG